MPYWRTLKIGGFLNDKYPGGVEGHRHRLELEGYKIVGKGKSSRVEELETYLFSF